MQKWFDEQYHAWVTNDVAANFHVEDEELQIIYRFNHPSTFSQFQIGCDSHWDEGFSSCELLPTSYGTALFRGCIDTDVPKTGTIQKAGWANVKSKRLTRSFGRKNWFKDWNMYTHVVLKVSKGSCWEWRLKQCRACVN